MLSYDAVGAPLGFTMLAYAMLWRNDKAPIEADEHAPAPLEGRRKQRDAARALA